MSYVYFVKYFITLHTFQNNLAYILESKAKGCFGQNIHFEGFIEIYAESEEAVKIGVIPVFIQGVTMALLSIFLYLMCKLYGF